MMMRILINSAGALCAYTSREEGTTKEHGVSAYAEQRKLSAAVSRQPDRKK